MRTHHFSGQNGQFAPKDNFFKEPISKRCRVYSCLSPCEKSKSDKNLLTRY